MGREENLLTTAEEISKLDIPECLSHLKLELLY